jgi:hypothetical protein
MALNVVQAKKIEALATSITVNGAMTVSSGSLMVVGESSYQGSQANHTASDHVNGTYTKAVGVDNISVASLHYKGNVTGGSLNLTAVSGGSSGATIASFHEVTGADTTAPFTIGESGSTTTTTSGTNPQTAQVTNATANSIFFAVLTDTQGGNPVTFTLNSTGTSPSGWALESSTESQEVNNNDWQDLNMPYLIVSSSAATRHGWATTSTDHTATVIAAFVEATVSSFTGTGSITIGAPVIDATGTVPEPFLIGQRLGGIRVV